MLVLEGREGGGRGGGKQENPDKTLLSGTKISDKPDPLMLSGPGFARGPYFGALSATPFIPV